MFVETGQRISVFSNDRMRLCFPEGGKEAWINSIVPYCGARRIKANFSLKYSAV